MKNLLSDKAFNRNLLKLALPLMFQALMLAMVAAADALMLGSIDQDSMSAVSLATQFQFLENMLFFATTGAFLAIGSQYWGKGDTDGVNDVFCICLRLCTVFSIVFSVGCTFFSIPLMRIFTNQKDLIEIGAGYLRIAGPSYLLTGISQSYLSLFKVTEKAKTSALISSTIVGLNIFLNAVLIFGLFGLPALGVNGAAVATLISRIAEFIWCILTTFKKGYLKPKISRAFKRLRELSHDFAVTVLPMLGAVMMWSVGFSSYSSFMGHLGEDATGANSIAAVVRDLVCCLTDGLASAGGIVVGNELGRGNLEKGKLYGTRIMVMSYVCGIASTVLMLAATPLLLVFVKLTPEAKKLLLEMMLVIAFYMVGRAVNTVTINGVFSAGGDTKFDAYSLAVTMWGIAVPLAALGTYVFSWPVILIYAFTCLDEVGKIPWTMYHFKKYKWVRDLTRDEH